MPPGSPAVWDSSGGSNCVLLGAQLLPCLLKESFTVDSCSAGFFFSWMHIHFLIYPYIESNGSKAIEVYTNVSLAFFFPPLWMSSFRNHIWPSRVLLVLKTLLFFSGGRLQKQMPPTLNRELFRCNTEGESGLILFSTILLKLEVTIRRGDHF